MVYNVYNKADKEDVFCKKKQNKKQETWQISKMARIKIFTIVLNIVINENVCKV